MENNEKRGKLSASFIMGAVALAFLAIGYQTALFVHRATQLRPPRHPVAYPRRQRGPGYGVCR